MSSRVLRSALERLFADAVAACDPSAAVRREVERIALLRERKVWLVAAGKAAGRMVEGCGGLDVVEGIVVVPETGDRKPETGNRKYPELDPPRFPVSGFRFPVPGSLIESAHPIPDARSEAAGRSLLALAARVPKHDVLLALISGGASSLIAVPARGITLDEKIARVGQVIARGAPIAEINRARTALSAIKGGRLAAACAAPVVTIVCSDVVGDDLAVVGSGPTIGAVPRGGDVAVLASGIGTLARAAAAAAPWPATIVDDAVTGDVEALADRIAEAVRAAAPPRALIFAGEPTVTLPARPGRGGRARQLALAVAKRLAGVPGWSLLAAGSDGVDGTSDAAGAIVDGDTWAQIPDGDGALARRDAGTALAACALVTGPTGVNHADVYVAVVC